jgi:hypothetical protein
VAPQVQRRERLGWRVRDALGVVWVVDELVAEPRHEEGAELLGLIVVLRHALPEKELLKRGRDEWRAEFLQRKLQQLGHESSLSRAHLTPQEIGCVVGSQAAVLVLTPAAARAWIVTSGFG